MEERYTAYRIRCSFRIEKLLNFSLLRESCRYVVLYETNIFPCTEILHVNTQCNFSWYFIIITRRDLA